MVKNLKKNRAGQLTCQTMVAVMLALAPVSAQGAPLERPDAGKTASNLQERRPALPDKPVTGLEVRQEQAETPVAPAGPKIKVMQIHITGQTVFPEEQLLPLVQDSFEQELTLAEIENLAGRVTKYFRDHGYIVAQAYVPAQDINQGVIQIGVLVGQYGEIHIRNNSQLAESVLRSLLSPLRNGDAIQGKLLERTLLLLSDTNGVTIKATLTPGKAAGTSDLIIESADTPHTTGWLTTDNYGNRFTGKNRGGVTININNASGHGDLLTLNGISGGSGINAGSIAYTLPFGPAGAKLGVNYSLVDYALGKNFAYLDASGQSKTTSFFVTYPFQRTRNVNLYGRLGYDHKQLQDKLGGLLASVSDKEASVWSLGLNGDNRDDWGGGGVNVFSLMYYTGNLALDSAADKAADAAAARTAGRYNKLSLNFMRTQYLADKLTLNFAFTGQQADKNLDSSEKLSLGGASAIRAYPLGEASGDEGYLCTGELRWTMPNPDFQMAAYIDTGSVKLNKNPWPGAGDNHRTLSGAGVGLIWGRPGDCAVRLDYAWKLGSEEARADTDKNGRYWLQAIKYF